MQDEEAEQRGGRFAEDNRAPTDDGETGVGGGGVDPLQLRGRVHGKDAGEDAARSEVSCGGLAIVADVTAHFEATGEALGMIAGYAGAWREIGWTAEDEIEAAGFGEEVGIAKVAQTDVEAMGEAVPEGGFEGEADAFGLGFDGGEVGAGKAPGGDHGDGTDAGAEIEDVKGRRAPRSAVPSGEDVVGGEAVAVGELEQAEVSADGVEGFAGIGGWTEAESAWGNGAGFGPALESGVWSGNRRAHSGRSGGGGNGGRVYGVALPPLRFMTTRARAARTTTPRTTLTAIKILLTLSDFLPNPASLVTTMVLPSPRRTV